MTAIQKDDWCGGCKVGFVAGNKTSCKGCYAAMGKSGGDWCEGCKVGHVNGKKTACKSCFVSFRAKKGACAGCASAKK